MIFFLNKISFLPYTILVDAKKKDRVKKVAYFLAGIMTGAANGLFGGGGGLMAVPCLGRFGGLDERSSHATAIAVITPLSFLSVLVYSVKGVSDPGLAIKVGSGVLIGGVIGSLFLRRIPKTVLTTVFYGVMIYAGVKYIL